MSKLPSAYRKDQKRLIDDSSTGMQRPPRVSINGNQFTLIDPSGERMLVPSLPDGPALNMVIVDRNEHTSKLFWGEGKAYNPSELAPPVCFSDNGTAPSSTAQDPQSLTCAACKWNVIGSAISQVSGVKIKACQDLKKFAVVVQGFQGVYLFEIKPGSFKAWNNYTSFLRMQKLPDGGRPDLSDVVTRVRFVGQGVMSFEAVALVENDLAAQVIEVWDKNQANDITGMMIGRFDQPAQAQIGQMAGPSGQLVGASQPVDPPPPQGSGLFFQQPAAPAPVAPGSAAPPSNSKPGRRKKEDGPAPVMPAQPSAPHGIQAGAASPPSDVQARLSNLFNLPPVK